MDKLAKLMQDIGILWEKYRMMYLNGMLNTLGLALAATAIGCIIGLLCGILNTIPCAKNDPPPKRILLKIIRVIIRIYVEVFRGTPTTRPSPCAIGREYSERNHRHPGRRPRRQFVSDNRGCAE